VSYIVSLCSATQRSEFSWYSADSFVVTCRFFLQEPLMKRKSKDASIEHVAGRLALLLGWFLKPEGLGVSETSTDFQRIKWHRIPDDTIRTLHNHCRGNFRPFQFEGWDRDCQTARTGNCVAAQCCRTVNSTASILGNVFAGCGNRCALGTWEPLKYNSVTSECDRWLMSGGETGTWVHRLTTEWCSRWWHQ
jgi:hypothetical protein